MTTLADDDLATALRCFQVSAAALLEGRPPLRPALAPAPSLLNACRAALASGHAPTEEQAAAFFGDHFRPAPLAEPAFFTGYYEPVVEGATAPGPRFTAPLLARPADLETFAADRPRPAWAADLAAARRLPAGGLAPYPTRAAIEADLSSYTPVAWVRDEIEAFLIHVQGSARIALEDGRQLRLTYAGRNGHPYTSIGRLLVERGAIDPAAMSLERLKAWLRDNGDGGRAVMRTNASFIFFSADLADDEGGPTGGAGVPLTPLRSIAVDRTCWSYGLPFWVDVALPAAAAPVRRLMIAQDTGSAIVGPARVDLFMGSGAAAGRQAGDIRHHGRLAVLLPRDMGEAP